MFNNLARILPQSNINNIYKFHTIFNPTRGYIRIGYRYWTRRYTRYIRYSGVHFFLNLICEQNNILFSHNLRGFVIHFSQHLFIFIFDLLWTFILYIITRRILSLHTVLYLHIHYLYVHLYPRKTKNYHQFKVYNPVLIQISNYDSMFKYQKYYINIIICRYIIIDYSR